MNSAVAVHGEALQFIYPDLRREHSITLLHPVPIAGCHVRSIIDHCWVKSTKLLPPGSSHECSDCTVPANHHKTQIAGHL